MEILGFQLSTKAIISGSLPFLTNVINAILIYLIGKWIAKKVVVIVEKVGMRSKIDKTLMQFLANVLYALMLVLIILASLGTLGINTSSALAILGGTALAVGMALQDEIANIAAGVMLILFRPYNIDDFIETNSVQGTVTGFNMMSTNLLTPDNHLIIIPNRNISGNAIINYTRQDTRRINYVIGIGYGDDIKNARAVMLKVINAHPNVLQDPEPAVKVTNLGDNSVDMCILVWVKTEHFLGTKLDLIESIKIALDEANIEIPYPQRNLQLVGMDKLLEKLDKQA